MTKSHLLISILLLSVSAPLFAYVGPGMGGGVIAAVVGVISAIFLGLFGIVYYPIKRAFKNRKNKAQVKEVADLKED